MTVPALEVKLIESRRERAAVRSHQANASRGGTPEPLKGTAFLWPRRLHRGEVRPDRSIPERPSVDLLGATAEGDTAAGCSWTAPGHSPGLGGLGAERGGSEQR